MLIQRVSGNPIGADIDIGGTVYEFRPAEGEVVCDVTDEEHAAHLLSIPGYRKYDTVDAPVKKVKKKSG